MATIDLTMDTERRKRVLQRVRERNIIIPTFAQMKDPAKIPAKIKEELAGIGLWDVNPRNLFRITWHNQPVAHGGGFGDVNYLELPSSLTGVPARDHRAGRQMVPHRGAQSRRGLWLPGAAPGYRTVRTYHTESGLAFDRQLLPRRRL